MMSNLRVTYPKDEIILIGHFNLSRMRWMSTENTPGFLLAANSDMAAHFNRACERYLLHQINDCHNSRGRLLGLVLMTNFENATVTEPHPAARVDKNSVHHSALAINVGFKSLETKSTSRIYFSLWTIFIHSCSRPRVKNNNFFDDPMIRFFREQTFIRRRISSHISITSSRRHTPPLPPLMFRSRRVSSAAESSRSALASLFCVYLFVFHHILRQCDDDDFCGRE